MKTQELQLLYIFNAIMTERSVTRAADRLAMTQPAVSNAISRMRQIWNDPLFVRKGRNIEPTSYALSLWHQVGDHIKRPRFLYYSNQPGSKWGCYSIKSL